MLSDLEKRVIASIQDDLPVIERPYRPIAERLGIPEDQLLGILRDLCRRGVIRRFGATLRHQKSGFAANAMGAWRVPEARGVVDSVTKRIVIGSGGECSRKPGEALEA